MAAIVVDVDTILRLANVYDQIGDATDGYRNALRFNDNSLDVQLNAFGVALKSGNAAWGTVGAAVGDMDARIVRVERHLRRSRDTLYDHAEKVNDVDRVNLLAVLSALGDTSWEMKFDLIDAADFMLTKQELAHGPLQGLWGGIGNIFGLVGGGLAAWDLGSFGSDTLSGALQWWESSGDAVKIAAAAVAIAGGPIGWVAALSLAGYASDLVFENWDAVTETWDSAVDEVGGFLSDKAYDLLQFGESLWGESVSLGGAVVSGLLGGVGAVADWLADPVDDVLIEAVRLVNEADSTIPILSDALTVTTQAWTAAPPPVTAPTPANDIQTQYELNRELIEAEIDRVGSLVGQFGFALQSLLNDSFIPFLNHGDHVDGLRWLAGQQVLHFDPQTGQLIVVHGDLATAKNVVVAIPGTGVNVEKIAGFSDPLGGLQGRLGPDTAIITWMDYDTPNDLVDALDMGDEFVSAHDSLLEFLQSIDQDGRTITLFGHSAGARVAQNLITDADSMGVVDQLVLSGSPDFAQDLPDYLDGRPVLVLANENDPVSLMGWSWTDWEVDAMNLTLSTHPGPDAGWWDQLTGKGHGFGSYIDLHPGALEGFLTQP